MPSDAKQMESTYNPGKIFNFYLIWRSIQTNLEGETFYKPTGLYSSKMLVIS